VSRRVAIVAAQCLLWFAVGVAIGEVLDRAVAATPAPVMSAEPAAVECWTKGRTFVHVIVRNTGTAPGRYTVLTEREDGTVRRTVSRLRPGTAELAGYMVRPGETVPAAYVRSGGVTLYYRVGVTGLPECA